MKLSALNSRTRKSLTGSRRGVLTAWTIWIMLTAGIITGSLFHVLWLSGVRNQAYNCAASAALAAGHGYLSDDMLRSRQSSFEYDGRVTRCRNAAISMVERCRPGTSLPSITEQQVLVDWSGAEGPVPDPSLIVPSRISVSFDSAAQSFSRRSFFGGLTGKVRSQPEVQASVCLEHAPVAFRPSPDTNVPVLPFSICDDAIPREAGQGAAISGFWTSAIESGPGVDQFSWNSESRMFERGPDGLPEVTVSIYSSGGTDSPDAFIPLCFGNSASSEAGELIPRWIAGGLFFDDLQSRGLQEISFPGTIPVATLTAQNVQSCAAALRQKSGEPCLLCLSSATPAQKDLKLQKDPTSLNLKRPVAVRIVQVASSASGSVKVTLQPCVMVTSTAVTASSTLSDAAVNRYVYSVRLIQ